MISPSQHMGGSCLRALAGFIGRRLNLYITCIEENALLQKIRLLEVLVLLIDLFSSYLLSIREVDT